MTAENEAEKHQIAALKRQAKDPRVRADVIDRDVETMLLVRLATVEKLQEDRWPQIA
jgi:hypothetical protein